LLCVEFVAFFIFIVYLGAIAVLFLFVIMMFNIHILEVRDNILRFLPLIILIFGVIFEMIYVTDLIHFNIEGNHFTTLFYSKKS
jgi:NADH:ubiquinone oxidoreductase subunit 6 (subunit J)